MSVASFDVEAMSITEPLNIQLAPDYDSIELGIGESLLVKAISESTGRSAAQVKADYKKTGDLGMVAQASRKTQKTLFAMKRLTVVGTFATLKEIAKASGHQVTHCSDDLRHRI